MSAERTPPPGPLALRESTLKPRPTLSQRGRARERPAEPDQSPTLVTPHHLPARSSKGIMEVSRKRENYYSSEQVLSGGGILSIPEGP